jgi:bifunctional non-homologous end joining protein LigD
MVKESIALSYQEGASDKVYNVELVEQSTGFVVNFAYGRRGNSLLTGAKTKEPVTYEVAKKAYDKLVKSKKAKGYKPHGEAGPINTVDDPEDSGVRPQLLNELTKEEAQKYINDDDYCMQEKFDGRRKMIARNEDGSVQGINKKGVVVALTNEVSDAVKSIKAPCILDGEDMGDKIMLFDDITEPFLPYKERYQILTLEAYHTMKELEVVRTAWNTNTKQIMFNRLIAERAEGVVFKNINAPHTPGRPASGGNQFKCKFYDTASCIVDSISSVKSSIGLKVYDDSHPVSLVGVSVGNATLYPNSPKVKVGDIVEIKYLYYNEGGSLYQPVLKEVRDDVDASECTLIKLKRKKDGK